MRGIGTGIHRVRNAPSILLATTLLATTLLATTPVDAAPGGEAAPERPLYELSLDLDPDAGRLTGQARITLPPATIADGRARFLVAASGLDLEVERIATPEGTLLEHRGPDGAGTIEVDLPGDPVGAGESVTVLIDYHRAVTDSDLRPFGYRVFAPFGPNSWAYPAIVLPEGGAPGFADFDVRLEHPRSLAVLTTGGTGEEIVESAGSSDDSARTRYTAESVPGFAIVAGEGFRVSRHEEGGATVVAFYHPDHADTFSGVIERTVEAAAWYRRTYGFFPLEEIGIIQGHPRWGGGYPLPNLYAMHLGYLADEHVTWITAHELGHYYWGLYVLDEGGSLDWLQLALGIWSDQLYLAQRKDVGLPEQWRTGRRQGDWFADYLEAVVAGHEQELGLPASGHGFDYNSLIRHGKAATGIYLQSLLMGPDRFLDLQRKILDRYARRELSEAEFIALLEEEGLDGAAGFFAAWKQDDARVEVTIRSVAPDPESGGWTVELERTGPVPYPVDVEVTLVGGETVRHVMAAGAGEDAVSVPSRPEAVRLDPDGLVPMWNSSHPEIRSAWARALERAGLDTPFLALASEVLDESPDDDYVRYLLIRRLFQLGRWEEAGAHWPASAGCEGRAACLAGIYAARSRVRAGDPAAAADLLSRLRSGAEQAGVGRSWETVREEIDAASVR